MQKLENIRLREERKKIRMEPVIFGRLTHNEYHRLQKAHVKYSGATGDPEVYAPDDGLDPYIATFLCEIPKVLRALGWKRPVVKRQGKTWVITRTAGR